MSKDVKTYEEESLERKRFGFWVYIMTDCILFATLFATYAVLRNNTAGGPGAKDLFSLPFILIETLILLTSSYSIGLALLAARKKDKRQMLAWLAVTFVLGASFLGMELYEFNHLISNDHGWRTSAFLSSYFALVGTHGLHILVGLLWISVLSYRFMKGSITNYSLNNLTMLGIFWHFLDIVWIFIFSFVYLIGAGL